MKSVADLLLVLFNCGEPGVDTSEFHWLFVAHGRWMMMMMTHVWTMKARRIDEDMTPTDMTIDYKVRSFLHLHSNFRYNSLGSTCTCRYLNVGTNVSQSASPSKLNFRFVGSPIVLHWKGHNSSIQSAIEVNEHLMAFKYIWSHLNITLSRPPNCDRTIQFI
jgi:hypothetical protein